MIYPDGSQVPEIDEIGYRLLYVQGRLEALEDIRAERWLHLEYYAKRKEIENEERLSEIQKLRILEGGKIRRLEKVHGNKGLIPKRNVRKKEQILNERVG